MSKINNDSDSVKARIQQELQGVKTQIKMPELKDDGVVENKSLGLQLKNDCDNSWYLRWFK
jgi:hypothetical protein